ncbi:mannosylglucosyl-3-phosphoglycerate phosphatase-like isoform X2 [Penaeus monodon]|uniref:mannosylglucosyl-3-phosphoglycerate phosphatase-like isoform X2 n=2 Tax=Penaeus monodon TaxID=6687 RepID=UPI0018A78C36|nr:mannosylglucosyl-3-phosphoglycerate phosphatase-like isoform X2 [Penaeus monodon]
MGHSMSKTLFCIGGKEVKEPSPTKSSPRSPTAATMVSAEVATANGDASSASLNSGVRAPSITILHFNDVYNVEEQSTEPKAGAARFKTALQSFADRDPLVLFSGDILAPSIMSSFTQGEQMVPVMNHFGIHCAVFGNHDFDFGLERLIDVASRTNFPWLMSNVDDNETGKPLADGIVSHVMEWHGWKIGLIGLVEQEWLETLATINAEQVTFTDYVDKGRELANMLKNQGCDYVIALTHMRTPNDIRLAENVDEIDLILGGHDHVYEIQKINDKIILKSGTDFREFSVVTLNEEGSCVGVDIQKVEVNSSFEPDSELKEALSEFEAVVGEKMEEPLGTFSVDLDGRFSSIRTSETNLGNFVCDIMMAATNADVAILNSGTLRSDRIHSAGEFKMRDLMTVLPMLDPLLVIEITGEKLLAALENGVSQYPKLEGRFPQVAGIQFAFDPNAAPGSRIIRDVVKVGDEYLDPAANYRLVVKAYMYQGRDGYQMLTECPIVQDEEQCPMLSTAVQNHFTAIKTRLGKSRRNSTHRQSLVLLSRRHSLIRHDDELPAAARPSSRSSIGRSMSTDSALSTASSGSVPSVSGRRSRGSLSRQESVHELEDMACKLTPKVDGRILVATDEGLIQHLRTQKALQFGIQEEEREA